MRDLRGHFGIVHRVRQVADQRTVDPPFGHLTNTKAAAQDTRVGVYPHVEDVSDAFLVKIVVDLGAVVRNTVLLLDFNRGVLACPGQST